MICLILWKIKGKDKEEEFLKENRNTLFDSFNEKVILQFLNETNKLSQLNIQIRKNFNNPPIS